MKFKFRRYYLYYLGKAAAFKFYILPLNVGLYIGKLLGALAFCILARYRNVTIENLQAAFGKEKTKNEIRGIAKRVFENLAKNTVELVNFPKINKDNIKKLVQVENIDRLNKAFELGKGVIILTSHFGNWELVGVTLRLWGYQGVVIVRRIYFDKYDKYLNRLRKVHDVDIIYRDESPKRMLRVLKENKIVGVLADQDVDSVDGVFVNFFGRPAYTPIGPVALAKASGAALVPTFIIRRNGKHTLVIEEPIKLADTGDKEKDIATNTQAWSNVVESYIRRYPDQWVWMHRRWKTQAAKG